MNMFSDVTVVCFDIDWTLIAHSSFQEEETLKLLGLKPDLKFTMQMRFFWDNVSEKLQNGKIVTEELLLYWADIMIPYLKENGIMAKDWLEASIKSDKTELIEGAYEILEYLQNKGYFILATTNWFTKNQIEILKYHNIFHFFEKVYGWDTVCAKPNKKALGNLIDGCNNTSFVLIGDSQYTDIQFANRLKIKSIWYNPNNNKTSRKIVATETIFKLSEIKKYL
ncbi:MAG: HAD hydrolase-like protein [Clostridia bacterium]